MACTEAPQQSNASRQSRAAIRETVASDSMGRPPTDTATVGQLARADVRESSGVARSTSQSVLFTINDSGNEPLLYALEVNGADRGAWRVRGASNLDWEAIAIGPCATPSGTTQTSVAAGSCVYIGDVGDNTARRDTRSIYRVPEPAAEAAGFTGRTPRAEQLVYRYPDGPRDVEAMYVASDGAVFLISKRSLRDGNGDRRAARVYRLSPEAWADGIPVTAQLVDSLSIVPGTAPGRQITDAALSPDGRHVAVRTYSQIFIFASDPAAGRIDSAVPPEACSLAEFLDVGEGITWLDSSGTLLLTNEGRGASIYRVKCPLPDADP